VKLLIQEEGFGDFEQPKRGDADRQIDMDFGQAEDLLPEVGWSNSLTD
jgi:hypothetical protein